MNRLKGFRTMIFNGLAAIPVVAQLLIEAFLSPEFGAVIPKEWLVEYTLAVLVMNKVLRLMTTTPMGRRE